MTDSTPSVFYQRHAQEAIITARKFYNSDSRKMKLKANLHFYNALKCATKALEIDSSGPVADRTAQSNMEAIFRESQKHLPHNIEDFIERCWCDYENRGNCIFRKLFGTLENLEGKGPDEIEQLRLDRLKKYFEQYPFQYGFLTQDKFVRFFSDQTSIYDNGSLWESIYAGCVRYTNTVLEFEILFREFLEYLSLKEYIESTKAIRFGEIWASMRKKYMNGKPYVQIDEMIADGRLDCFSADEIVAAIHFCLVYKERFCEGYFMDCCEDGIIGKLLLRLNDLACV